MSEQWSEQEMEIAKSMTLDGRSATEIGTVIGKSRNAVIGKWHRNPDEFKGRSRQNPRPNSGRPRTASEDERKRKVKVKPFVLKKPSGDKPKPWKPRIEAIDAELEATILAYSIPLLDMRDDLCHWITQEGPFLYCGQPQDDDKSGKMIEEGYCPLHGPRMRDWGKGKRR